MILGGKRSISLTKGSEELSKELILNGEAIREPVLEAMREDTTGLQCCYKSRIRSVTRALQGDLLLRIRRAHDSPMRDGAHDSPTGHDPKTFITALLSAAHSEKSSFTEEACLFSGSRNIQSGFLWSLHCNDNLFVESLNAVNILIGHVG